MAKTQNKTQVSGTNVDDFVAAIDHPVRRADAVALNDMFKRVTGWQPRMWGPTIIGYGQYHYTYDSGRAGDMLATGFSPRKASLSVYILPGYSDFSDHLARLGKHRIGKSCLYINKMADVDMAVLEELVRAGLDDLATRWTVTAT